MLLFINLNTSVIFSHTQKQKDTQHMIFLTISILQQKKSQFWPDMDCWCCVLWFNCFYFIKVISTFDTASCNFCDDKFYQWCQLLYLMKVLIFLIPWFKAWHIQFTRIVIKLQQSITKWNLHHKINEIIQTTEPYYNEIFTHFDFDSVLPLNTNSWVANIYYTLA